MSRLTLQHKAGLVFALTALVVGLSSSAALGWANEREHGNKGDHGHKNKPGQPGPTGPSTPPVAPKPLPPPQLAPPAGPAPAPQVVPTQTPAPVKALGKKERKAAKRRAGGGQAPVSGRKVLAEAGAPETVAIAPTSETGGGELASTGLDPLLLALLGVFCVAGGGFLFRRGLAR
jgi:hypothetical protein